jgi:hypothetical protein
MVSLQIVSGTGLCLGFQGAIAGSDLNYATIGLYSLPTSSLVL